MDRVLGLGLDKLESADIELSEEQLSVVREREQARAAKDWAKADILRARLLEMGIEIKDTSGGTQCRKRGSR